MSNRNGKFNIKDIVQIIGKTIGSYLGVVSECFWQYSWHPCICSGVKSDRRNLCVY